MRMICQSGRRIGGALTVSMLVAGGLLLGSGAASAQTCIQDVWTAHGNNQNLTCTANDVTLSRATVIAVTNGGSCEIVNGQRVCRCLEGGDVTFTARFQMDLTADTRYDIGFYIAKTDPNNDGALTGSCTAVAALDPNTENFLNLDPPGDLCGDITGPLNTEFNPQFVTASVTTQCVAGPSGELELDFCTTWRQPGSNEQCDGIGDGTAANIDVYPGSPSKCNCGVLTVPIEPTPPSILVEKTALPPAQVLETGGEASYNVTVTNQNLIRAIELTTLTDTPYGDITTVAGSVTATTCVPDGNIATCEIGGSLEPGASCSCTFTAIVPPGDFGGPGFRDEVRACGEDILGRSACDTDDAVVQYLDRNFPPTLSKTATNTACQVDVTYAVVVTNGSNFETLTLNTLSDVPYGDITTVQGNVVSTTCGQVTGAGALPIVIAPSGNYTCSFVGRVNVCNLTRINTVTASAVDEDAVLFTPSDTAEVRVSVITPP